MEKMMTFEEWMSKYDRTKGATWDDYHNAWKSALLGMIPAENAVTLEWDLHKGCKRARIIYEYGETGEVTWKSGPGSNGASLCLDGNGKIEAGYWTRAPKPVWVPNVGEAVFFRTYNNGKSVGEFRGEHETFDTCWKVMNTDGNMVLPAKCDCKPFHESHIGKPWSEIPGGVE